MYMVTWCIVQGVADRDQIVVQRVRTRGLPIAIIAGGGFTRTASSIVAHSVLNLYHLGLIPGPSAGQYASVIANTNIVYLKITVCAISQAKITLHKVER